MTVRSAAEAWADTAVSTLLDDYVRHPKPFTVEEVGALIRAAYGVGYVNALNEREPLPMIDACSYAEALRLVLPLP